LENCLGNYIYKLENKVSPSKWSNEIISSKISSTKLSEIKTRKYKVKTVFEKNGGLIKFLGL
jgi:hypothetical protein